LEDIIKEDKFLLYEGSSTIECKAHLIFIYKDIQWIG